MNLGGLCRAQTPHLVIHAQTVCQSMRMRIDNSFTHVYSKSRGKSPRTSVIKWIRFSIIIFLIILDFTTHIHQEVFCSSNAARTLVNLTMYRCVRCTFVSTREKKF
jgi:hypothetical protein